jgi:hypothetical protein
LVLTLKEEQRLRVFENRVLRRIFGPKTEEGARGWRRLHNEELRNFYTSPNIINVIKLMMMKWSGHVAGMGEMAHTCNILVGKPEGKSPLGRSRRRWEDNTRMDLKKIGCELDASG